MPKLLSTEEVPPLIPSKIFESMAMEKPIILGVEGERAELVRASGGGVCIEPENGKDLADQVFALYHDPARCKELGTHGRHYVLTHFDRQVLTRKLTDVMQHVVSNG